MGLLEVERDGPGLTFVGWECRQGVRRDGLLEDGVDRCRVDSLDRRHGLDDRRRDVGLRICDNGLEENKLTAHHFGT